jgi:hypothetical protein
MNKIKLPVIPAESHCCGAIKKSPSTLPRINQPFILGSTNTPAGKLPQVAV